VNYGTTQHGGHISAVLSSVLKNPLTMTMIFEGFIYHKYIYHNSKEMGRFWRSCTVIKLSAETLTVKIEFNYFKANKR
jgi:hypothetical protein